MKVEITDKATPKKILITQEKEELKRELDKYFNSIKDTLKIDGFRKGKLTRKQAEQSLGTIQLYKQYLDELYYRALRDNNINCVYVLSTRVLGNIDDTQDLVIEAIVYLRPEVQLADLSTIKIEKEDTFVTDDDIDKKLKLTANNRAEFVVVDRPSKMGDVLKIDYVGRIDGKEFQGGKANDYKYELGLNQFIDQFDEKIVGMKAGETRKAPLTFPANYMAKELQGKKAEFEVVVKEVIEKRIPLVTDEWIQQTFHKNIEEYKKELLVMMLEERTKIANENFSKDVLKAIIKDSTVGPVPDEVVDSELQFEWFDYLQRLNKTEEELSKDQPHAKDWFFQMQKQRMVDGLKSTFIIEEIAIKNDMSVSNKELDAYIKEKSSAVEKEKQNEMIRKIKSNINDYEKIRKSLVTQKVIDFLLQQCKK